MRLGELLTAVGFGLRPEKGNLVYVIYNSTGGSDTASSHEPRPPAAHHAPPAADRGPHAADRRSPPRIPTLRRLESTGSAACILC